MTQAVPMVEIWRGNHLESQHMGHAVVCSASGEVMDVWGNPEKVIYPRSSAKMLQAIPLIESGAADAFGLTGVQLALACASHDGAGIHRSGVDQWLKHLGLDDSALRCGPQVPDDTIEHERLVRAHQSPCQMHNNCSGKHAGFLTLAAHLGAGAEYLEIDHPVQVAVLDVFEEMTGATSPGYGIDGCSAPNFLTTLSGFAKALARMTDRSGSRGATSERLVNAMMAHPEYVAGDARACTKLMRAMKGRAAIKTGAEGVYAAIVPELELGVAVKIEDGTTRASEAAIAGILVKYGVLERNHPAAIDYLHGPIRNRRNIETGCLKLSPDFMVLG